MEKDNESEMDILRHMQGDINFLKQAILQLRDEMKTYPPESSIKKTFIKDVEEAQNRVRVGKGRNYTSREFEAKFCE